MIPHNKLSFSKNEKCYVNDVLDSRRLSNGSYTERFENGICDLLGLPNGHAVAVTSGSAALFIALQALDAQNKKVAIPSFVCSSLRNACTLSNSLVHICDIEGDSLKIDQKELTDSQSDILINPYLFGISNPLPDFKGSIIEDCAQSLGAKFRGKSLGTIGDIGILSFYATKLITSGGQGGMLVSKNKDLIDFSRDFINFDMRKDASFRFNFSITEIQAAVGLAQLEEFPEFLQKRNEIWDIYHSMGLNLIESPNKGSVRYRAVVKTPDASKLIRHLHDNKISAIVPIEEWELLSKTTKNAIKLSNSTVSIPLYPTLSKNDACKIASVIGEFNENIY